jgi:hypothetical protein
MARVALILVALLILLRILLLVKLKPEAATRRFRLSTIQVLIAATIVGSYAIFGPKVALAALLSGLAAIISVSFLPSQRRPR